MPRKAKRFKKKKFRGDDAYSWAVFDGHRPVYTGLSMSQANYYLRQLRKQYKEE